MEVMLAQAGPELMQSIIRSVEEREGQGEPGLMLG